MKVLRAFLLAVVCVPITILLVLAIPLPASATAWLARHNSAGLLFYPEQTRSPWVVIARKTLGSWVEHNIARHVFNRNPLPKNIDEAQRIGLRLAALKATLISQTELPHRPALAPTSIAGIGWCDYINAFAGIVLANEFDRVEVVGFSGHSIGRVWSNQYRDWLYFDVWADEIVVFTDKPNENARYLFRSAPLGHPNKSNEGQLSVLYDGADTGFTLYRRQANAGFNALYILRNMLLNGTTLPDGARQGINGNRKVTGPSVYPSKPVIRTKASASYVEARLQHLLGDTDAARAAYLQTIAQDRESAFALASRIFVRRIG